MSGNTKGNRCGLYIRGTVKEQGVQTTQLTAHAIKNGWRVAKVYKDQATGQSPTRVHRAALLHDLKYKAIDIVVVTDLERLFSNLKVTVATLAEIHSQGGRFIVVNQDLDTDTCTVPHLISLLSSLEPNLTRQKVKSGLAAARARGVRIGRPGLTEEVTALVQRLRAEGKSLRVIAKEAGIGKTTAERILTNKK